MMNLVGYGSDSGSDNEDHIKETNPQIDDEDAWNGPTVKSKSFEQHWYF
jgi:hypothetical protein